MASVDDLEAAPLIVKRASAEVAGCSWLSGGAAMVSVALVRRALPMSTLQS